MRVHGALHCNRLPARGRLTLRVVAGTAQQSPAGSKTTVREWHTGACLPMQSVANQTGGWLAKGSMRASQGILSSYAGTACAAQMLRASRAPVLLLFAGDSCLSQMPAARQQLQARLTHRTHPNQAA